MLKTTKRAGSPHYQITGTYRGVRIRQTAGTTCYETAEKYRTYLERLIEENAYHADTREKTFADATEAYLNNGGEERFLERINEAIGPLPLNSINQEVIDNTAREIYGAYRKTENGKIYEHKSSTIKRQFYDPVAAVLHYAAELDWTPYRRVKKPKISPSAPEWAEPEYFTALWSVCDKEIKALTMFLCFTGCRIQECLDLEWNNVDLKHGKAFIPKTKTKTYRTVHLPKLLIASLRAIKASGRVFQLTYDDVRRLLKQACREAGIPYMSTHKIGSHTYATWMRRYAGVDARGLMDTGRWASLQMAERYTHTDVSAESKKADKLADLFK